MLAESAPAFTNTDFASWCGIAFFLVAGINQVSRFMDRLKGSPSGAEAAAEAKAKYVTRDELDDRLRDITRDIELQGESLKKDTAEIINKIDRVKTELMEASERRIISVHERLNEISAIAVRAEDRTHSLRDPGRATH